VGEDGSRGYARRFKLIDVDEQCEVLSLIGEIAEGFDGKASMHFHAALGLPDGSLRGGHFLSGVDAEPL
jgi:uncharacterized protein